MEKEGAHPLSECASDHRLPNPTTVSLEYYSLEQRPMVPRPRVVSVGLNSFLCCSSQSQIFG